MEFQSVQYTVDRMIQWVRTGRLGMPNFQRDFVWTPAQVVELLDSVAKQWPIGSLLLMSGSRNFDVRPLEAAPPISERPLDKYVLDGQQRLTGLFHAISDVSDYCYFVDFEALQAGADDYLRWERRRSFERRLRTSADRAAASVALVKEVWDPDTFYSWLENVRDISLQKEYSSLRNKQLRGLQSQVYKMMAIELDEDIHIEALARIFETINRTGVPLNAFDLMVAVLVPTGFNLRDEWDRALLLYDSFETFDVDPLEVLKLAALLIRVDYGKAESRGVRQGDLLRLDRTHIRDVWGEAVELYDATLTYLRLNLGVFGKDVIPSWAMVLTVAMWLRIEGDRPRPIAAWFWGSAFALSYAQGANSMTVSDVDALAGGWAYDLASDRASTVFPVLDEPARRNGLAMRALAAFLASRGALDPVTGRPLSESSTVAFRAWDDDGSLRKLRAADSFDKLVVMSKDSEKRLSKQNEIPGFHAAADNEVAMRLGTQLFDVSLRCRDVNEIRQSVAAIFPGDAA